MISYEYAQVNRLDEPHKYMYTAYQGAEFISAYFDNRLQYMNYLQSRSDTEFKSKIDLFLYSGILRVLNIYLDVSLLDKLNKSLVEVLNWQKIFKLSDIPFDDIENRIEKLSAFAIDDRINSEKLLFSLLHNQLTKKNELLSKFWIDHLIDRFEVTKKLYEIYPPGFRKGEGKTNVIRLYWLFSLSLALSYFETKNIKCLSALLKIMDLLCSLDKGLIEEYIPPQGMLIVLIVESLSVRSLSKTINEVIL